jgi:hypothetical protein
VGLAGMKAPAREHTEIYTADGVGGDSDYDIDDSDDCYTNDDSVNDSYDNVLLLIYTHVFVYAKYMLRFFFGYMCDLMRNGCVCHDVCAY